MDITKSSYKIKSFKYLNGETVNYTVCFFAVSLFFIILKQVFKIVFSVPASIALGVSFAVSAVILFMLEKRFVYNKAARGSNIKQILLYAFRCAIDYGFYSICSFVFGNILKCPEALVYLMSFFVFFAFNYYFDRLIVFDCNKPAKNNVNGRLYRLFWNYRFIPLSVLITASFIGLLFLTFSVFPFGDRTVLRMDLYHQYGPLFCELYDRVTNGGSFLYSWISGGGSSFLGNYFNYLSSPLTAILFLFDRKEMPLAITTIIAVKGLLSSATFTYYIKKSLNRHSAASACFGSFYALSGYYLAYYWNIMWLDAMFLLPIIVLGIERIINKGKPVCYIASLTVMFFSSYYMAYMICIFSVIYFLAYFALKHSIFEKLDCGLKTEKRYSFKKAVNNRFVYSGLIFAGASLLAAMLCAVTLIPVYYILQNSSATSDSFPSSFELYHDLLSILSSHLASLETTIRSSGDDVLPNVYCSVLSLILLPLYAANKKIRVREKAVYILLAIFFICSFNINYLNFIWHAFHFPNDLPYRFSYMYSFILLVIAFRTLMNIKGIEYRDIAFSGIFWVFTVIILQKYMTNKMLDRTIYINIGLILVWTAFLLVLHNRKLSKSLLSLTLCALTFSELCISDLTAFPFSQNYSTYTENYDTYREAIEHTYGEDKSFYRTELSKLNTRMDSCLFGYRGISTFSSMAYETYSGNQYSLGMYGNRINSYTYNTQTPVYNMLYSIKYVMRVNESLKLSPDYYAISYTTKDSNCDVYENKYFLPVGFVTAADIKDAEIEEGNPFTVQEDIIDKACGISDVFVPVKYALTDCNGIQCETVSNNGTYYFSKEDSEDTSGTVDVTVKAVTDSNLYVYITSPKIENVNYYWNNDDKSTYQNIDTPYIMDLGKHKKGDEIRISLECGSIDGDSSYFEIYAYSIDYEKFVSAYDMLKTGAFNITSYSDTHLKGTVDAGYNGYLYTSIPYDDGWSIYIDGKKQKNIKLHDAQLACEITKGKHEVELKYTPGGLLYGAEATAVAWAGIGIFAVLKRFRKKKAAETVETV